MQVIPTVPLPASASLRPSLTTVPGGSPPSLSLRIAEELYARSLPRQNLVDPNVDVVMAKEELAGSTVATVLHLRQAFITCRTVEPRDNRMVHSESDLGYRDVNAPFARDHIEGVRERPLTIIYVDADGVRRNHVVDLLMRLRSGITYGVLLEPTSRSDRSHLEQVRDMLIVQAPMGLVDQWVIASERNLPRYALANGRLLEDVRLNGPASDAPIVERVAAIVNGRTTIDAAVRLADGGEAFRALVRLLADGRLRLCHAVRIGAAALNPVPCWVGCTSDSPPLREVDRALRSTEHPTFT